MWPMEPKMKHFHLIYVELIRSNSTFKKFDVANHNAFVIEGEMCMGTHQVWIYGRDRWRVCFTYPFRKVRLYYNILQVEGKNVRV